MLSKDSRLIDYHKKYVIAFGTHKKKYKDSHGHLFRVIAWFHYTVTHTEWVPQTFHRERDAYTHKVWTLYLGMSGEGKGLNQDVMSCEKGITPSKNRSDIYCVVGLTVYLGFIWTLNT